MFGAGLQTAVIALSVAYTPYVARVLRGAALRERAQPYVSALEVQGLRRVAICLAAPGAEHLGLVVAQATILFGYAMVDLAAISFIGLGVQSPTGRLGRDGRRRASAGVLHGLPARRRCPRCLCIVVVVVAVNLLGERLSERAQDGSDERAARVDGLTVPLPVEGAQRAVTARRLARRSARARRSAWSASPGPGKSMTARAIGAAAAAEGAVVTGAITFDGRDVLALSRRRAAAVPRPRWRWCSRTRARTSTRCAGSATS